MVCKICGCDSWHLKGLYWRCVNCNHIRKAPGTTIALLKKEMENATGKKLRDIKFLLKKK
jgi:hypothetical protein